MNFVLGLGVSLVVMNTIASTAFALFKFGWTPSSDPRPAPDWCIVYAWIILAGNLIGGLYAIWLGLE